MPEHEPVSRTDVPESGEGPPFTFRLGLTMASATAVVFAAFVAVYAANAILLVFAGILAGIFLRGLADIVGPRLRLSSGWALALVCLLLAGFLAALLLFVVPQVLSQLADFREQLPRLEQEVRKRISEWPMVRDMASEIPAPREILGSAAQVARRAMGVFSTAFGALSSLLIVALIGLYLAANPSLYREGLVRLVPIPKRPRAREVLDDLGSILWRLLMGRLFSMFVVGLLSWLGLTLLGVPLALTLGLLAGLLDFVPNIGPIAAAVPAILLALSGGLDDALWVTLLYVAVQSLESYILLPLVQMYAVSMPPVLLISVQIAAGLLLGIPGLILATPLTAAAMVLVRMLYVEDWLGDRSRGTEAGDA